MIEIVTVIVLVLAGAAGAVCLGCLVASARDGAARRRALYERARWRTGVVLPAEDRKRVRRFLLGVRR